MKYYLYILGLTLGVIGVQAVAQNFPPVTDCNQEIAEAENNNDTAVYDRCGFNDPDVAWTKWSGLASQKNWRKAMYQLCVRYPTHQYSALYCEKSANLGYGPALVEQGHKAMKEGMGTLAITYYTRALESDQLSEEQEADVAEQVGLYYFENGTDHYVPSKAIAFFQTAAGKGSALANDVLGVLSYTGEYGVKKDNKVALEFFWRSALLGCQVAQENIGLFHLARQDKISYDTAKAHMLWSMLVCERKPGLNQPAQPPKDCNCENVLAAEERASSKPYYLLEVTGEKAKLRDKKGATQYVQKGQKLTTGYTISEVRPTAVILIKGSERVILNLYKPDACLSYCQQNPTGSVQINDDVQIRPYHFTFTPQECSDIMYYAAALVDTSKPFVGKTQCAAGNEVATDDPLLNLLKDKPVSSDDNEGVIVDGADKGGEPIALVVPTAQGTQQQISQGTEHQRVRPELNRTKQVRRSLKDAEALQKARVRAAAEAEAKANAKK